MILFMNFELAISHQPISKKRCNDYVLVDRRNHLYSPTSQIAIEATFCFSRVEREHMYIR